MRIVCDNCGAKYQISDEKVRNKVFKIRCKRCAHVIVVRANQPAEEAEAPAENAAPAESAATAASAEPAAAASAPGAVWYVVINREQVGPLAPEQVLAHFERKEIDADTFTWAEGMADWVRLATIPEFADHVAAAAPEPAPTEMLSASSVAAGVAVDTAAAGSGSLFDDGGDDDVIASNNQSESLFGDDKDGFDGGGPRVSSGQQLRNQRNENSVLFSLDSLAADAEPSRPAVSNTGGTDGSGLIDISALGAGAMGASVAPGALDDAFGGGSGDGGFAPVSAAPAGPMPTYVTRPSGGGGKIALFAVLGILLLGGGAFAAWYFTREPPKDPNQPGSVASAPATDAAPATVSIGQPASAKSAATAAPATATSVASAAPASAPASAPESAAPESLAANTPRPKSRARRSPRRRAAPPKRPTSREDQPPKAAPKPVAVSTKAPARKPRKSNGEVDDLLSNLDGGGRKAPARPSRSAAPANSGTDPMLPAKLSKSQILSVVRRNAGKIGGCKSRDPNASGAIKVQMVINKNGRVGSAKSQGKYAGTPIGSCVEGKVKSFRFPQFSGDAMRINMPFRL